MTTETHHCYGMSHMATRTDHYDRGYMTGKKHAVITIALNDTWGGTTRDGGHTTSYEKIGYHAGSVDFLDGVLASGCPVIRMVDRGGELARVTISKNPWR